MIILRVEGTITNVAVDEKKYASQMGVVDSSIKSYLYDGAVWVDEDDSSTADFTTLGITYDGTAAQNDTIIVAYHKSAMTIFVAGEGIPAPDLNTNFDQLKTQSNQNESDIITIENTALRIDGSNIDDATIAAFNRNITVTLPTTGSSTLTDNAEHFLAPAGNCTLNMPSVAQGDQYSHTINVAVQGSNFSVTLKEDGQIITRHLLNGENVNTTLPYNLLLMYNHSDGHWYYYISQ